jgi:hypothetical protein
MSHTCFANGRSVCTKGTPDEGFAAADPCKTPDDEDVVPPNNAPLANLGKGKTTSVKVAGQPVWTENGRLEPDTNPDHPGTAGGVSSGTFRGWCEPTSWSPNVIFEGGHVVRMFDTTIQNSGNCTGIVMLATAAADASAAALKAALAALDAQRKKTADDADKNKVADGANKQGAGQTAEDPDAGETPEETNCTIEWARLEDSNGRGVDDSGTLEIVPKSSETMTCTGEIEGTCATDQEAKWEVKGYYRHDATAVSTTFAAKHWPLGAGWLGYCAPRSTNVTFSAGGATKNFTLCTYPDDWERVTLKVPEALTNLVKGASIILNKVSKKGIKVKGPNFVVMCTAQWAEDPDSTVAFYKYSIKGGAKPILSIAGTFSLLPNPALSWLLDKIGIGLYMELKVEKRLTLDIVRDTPGLPTPGCTASGLFTITIFFEAESGSKEVGAVSIGIFGRGTLSATGKMRGDTPGIEVGCTIEAQGFVKAKFGLIWEFEKRATVIEKKSILGDPPPFIDLTALLP